MYSNKLPLCSTQNLGDTKETKLVSYLTTEI